MDAFTFLIASSGFITYLATRKNCNDSDNDSEFFSQIENNDVDEIQENNDVDEIQENNDNDSTRTDITYKQIIRNTSVPNFGETIKQNVAGTGIDNDFQKEDHTSNFTGRFTGRDNVSYKNKDSVNSMFEPDTNIEKINGPLTSSGSFGTNITYTREEDLKRFSDAVKFKDDRIEGTNVQIGRGLNIDANTPNSDGFHPMFRDVHPDTWTYKLNQLRGEYGHGVYTSSIPESVDFGEIFGEYVLNDDNTNNSNARGGNNNNIININSNIETFSNDNNDDGDNSAFYGHGNSYTYPFDDNTKRKISLSTRIDHDGREKVGTGTDMTDNHTFGIKFRRDPNDLFDLPQKYDKRKTVVYTDDSLKSGGKGHNKFPHWNGKISFTKDKPNTEHSYSGVNIFNGTNYVLKPYRHEDFVRDDVRGNSHILYSRAGAPAIPTLGSVSRNNYDAGIETTTRDLMNYSHTGIRAPIEKKYSGYGGATFNTTMKEIGLFDSLDVVGNKRTISSRGHPDRYKSQQLLRPQNRRMTKEYTPIVDAIVDKRTPDNRKEIIQRQEFDHSGGRHRKALQNRHIHLYQSEPSELTQFSDTTVENRENYPYKPMTDTNIIPENTH